MEMYEGNYLTERELELYWDVLVDVEDTILELIEAKDSKMGAIFYDGLTIVYKIDCDGDAIIEHITETISIEGIENAE